MRQVDFPHPSVSQQRDDPVGAHLLTHLQFHWFLSHGLGRHFLGEESNPGPDFEHYTLRSNRFLDSSSLTLHNPFSDDPNVTSS